MRHVRILARTAIELDRYWYWYFYFYFYFYCYVVVVVVIGIGIGIDIVIVILVGIYIGINATFGFRMVKIADYIFCQGRTFSGIIKHFLKIYRPLNETYLPLYETEAGKKIYEETLSCVEQQFPGYLREIQGTADGANVPFHKVNRH